MQPYSILEETLSLRLSALRDLIQLCNRQEPRGPRLWSDEDTTSSEPSSMEDDREQEPILCAVRTCLFCLGNEQLAPQHRRRNFSNGNRLATHLENQHYRYIRHDLGGFTCPHPACGVLLKGVSHFQNHATKTHGVRFTPNCGKDPREELDLAKVVREDLESSRYQWQPPVDLTAT
ncbi:MAG: hypothetical protein MMC33_003517 [Icmadophila ericetorum]|nr:hypothetical protein [Icmadophila ericetorum]